MKEYRYADGLEEITLSEGMVRMELFHYTGAPAGGGANKHPSREVTQQLVLPPAGFLEAFEAMRQFMEQLEARGVVTRRSAHPHSSEGMQHSASPNFE